MRASALATPSWPASHKRAARSPSDPHSKSETQSHNADHRGTVQSRAPSEDTEPTEEESPNTQFSPQQVRRSASLQFHPHLTPWTAPSNSGTRHPETSSPEFASRCHTAGNA